MKTKIFALFLSVLSACAFADTRQVEEYNFTQKINKMSISQRTTDPGEFLQATYSAFDGGWIGYRYSHNNNNNHEHRYMIQKNLYKDSRFTFLTRLEYRDFKNSESHFRPRLELWYRYPITESIQFWAKLSPRLSFVNDDVVFSSRDQMGLNFKFKNITFGPFIDRSTKDSMSNHTATVIGTNFVIKI